MPGLRFAREGKDKQSKQLFNKFDSEIALARQLKLKPESTSSLNDAKEFISFVKTNLDLEPFESRQMILAEDLLQIFVAVEAHSFGEWRAAFRRLASHVFEFALIGLQSDTQRKGFIGSFVERSRQKLIPIQARQTPFQGNPSVTGKEPLFAVA